MIASQAATPVVPEVPVPDVPLPDVPLPDVPLPDVLVPDVLVPDVLVPDALVPSESPVVATLVVVGAPLVDPVADVLPAVLAPLSDVSGPMGQPGPRSKQIMSAAWCFMGVDPMMTDFTRAARPDPSRLTAPRDRRPHRRLEAAPLPIEPWPPKAAGATTSQRSPRPIARKIWWAVPP